jgi:hypothetical protein
MRLFLRRNRDDGAGWPDWANFRPLGDFLLWKKIQKYPEIFGLLLSTLKFVC